ncbi:hypothetical protein H8A99_04065 [Bradyrhizobium sp. Arg68]|uniref:hypothetical protein n=1 Tax=Bradyrhizobium ivorense TaxID=2511166 RepID=UPI001E64ACE5|nr:hypothetical protein [Bradyrhizobium ivorense]MCC8935693.1 hypothetical protein [Bradyrhizobium ivorense]
MTRIVVFVASLLVHALTIPAVASECASMTEIAASRAHLTSAANQRVGSSDTEKTCRAYAESFYRIVLTRQAVAACAVGRPRDLALLDSEINAINNLLATRCGG